MKKKLKRSLVLLCISLLVCISCNDSEEIIFGFTEEDLKSLDYVANKENEITPVDIRKELINARKFALYVLMRRKDVIKNYSNRSLINEDMSVVNVELDKERQSDYLITNFSLPKGYDIVVVTELTLNNYRGVYEATGEYHMCTTKNDDSNCNDFLRRADKQIIGCNSCNHSIQVLQ